MSVTENKEKETVDEDEIEIRVSDIIQFFKDSRRQILLGVSIGFVIGALYAFNKPNQYSAQATVMPEIQSKTGSLSGLGSLAGLAGLDISGATGSTDAVRPDIYPDILQSVPFALHILQQRVYSQRLAKETSLQEFLDQQDSQSWFSSMVNASSDETPLLDPNNRSKTLQITKKQEALIKQVHKSITATFDKKTGIIKVETVFTDPVVAATLARLSLQYLTSYVASYRTEKVRNQVTFLTKQVAEAKHRYQIAEYTLSTYRDKNRNLFLQTAKIEEQRLEADFLLAQNVFNDLSKQLEQAKIKVEEQAPVFKILEPAQIPLKKSGPQRTLITVGFAFVGGLIGLIIMTVRRLKMLLS
ncbi:lipopolysaccharide biosynthesis protein [Spirosoma oryzicola]|uniref:lipopolysaccharide biosynthesis protein n=1 Tax=Spirosoma oryzicola TaxID=2898794 RepID=UPI001E58320B|nr:lipopolysaccharide biosynthesis protein [Spirosoma oryzicola]UHG91708.1 lipopolysaccharide biosynthesis protein [Spirosoma oryzicola]